jgi:hypothetical protein
MYKLLLPLLLLCTLTGFAQKASIKGKIIDSLNKKPVEMATVAVLNTKDTTAAALITYAQTDKEGSFEIHNIPVGIPLKVIVSFVGYQSHIRFFTLLKNQVLNMGNVQLNSRQLNEVVIKGERMPIVIRKDTIEFDAAAFKVRPNAVVEDLLKKLPGVEVTNQGKITVMGKDVTKVLVDGREFFPSDIRMATKNLDADMIAKVQVYDDRENDPDHLVPQNNVNKIINLKFKKALRKSIFGKVYGGAGTQDHYQTGGLFNIFRDTLQVSLLGYTNNLNSTGFDFNDLYSNGGLNRGGDAFYRGGFGGFGRIGAQGKQTATTAGVNINTDYGRKFKMNLAYVYKHTNTINNSINNRQQFLADTTTTTNSTSNSLSKADSHIITGTLTWRPDDKAQLIYSPSLNIMNNNGSNISSGNSFTNFVNPINNSTNSGNSNNNTLSFQQSLSYNKQLKKKGSSININHNISYNPGSGTNFDNQNFTSYTATFPSYVYRQQGDNINRNGNGNVSVSYRTPISKKIAFDAAVTSQYNSAVDKVSTYDYNPVTGQYDSFLLMKSSDLTRHTWAENLNTGLTYDNEKGLNIMAHINPQVQQVTNIFNRSLPNIDKNFFYTLPSASITYKSYSLSYANSVQLPNIGDMIPYTVVFSPQYSVTGNPDLKPTLRNSFSLSYRKYNYQKGFNLYFTGSANFEENSIVRKQTQTSQLVETSTPINRDGRYNYNVNGSIGKQIKKWKDVHLNFNTSLSLATNHDFFVLNQQDGYQNNYRVGITQHISLNYKDIIQLDPEYTLSEVYTNYTGVNYNNQNNLTHNLNTQFTFFLPKKYNIDGTYTYYYNPQVTPGFQKSSNLLNLSLAHQFLPKDRAEIKLSCYDILDQSISNTRYIGYNSITDNQTEMVRRYFMITLLFKFNKASYKDEPKPGLNFGRMRL